MNSANLYAVIKVDIGEGSTYEPTITNIVMSHDVAVNAAEHVYDDFVEDYKANFPDRSLDQDVSDTYKRCISDDGLYGVIVKVQPLPFDISFTLN